METKLVCVWLVSRLIHTISGCSLSAPGGVTGYTGGTVLLPCFCTDGGTIPRSARWHFQPGPSSVTLWSSGGVDDRYKDRALISDSPGNMSLHLSDLTLSDGGLFRCEADKLFKDIKLTVKGCVFSDSGPIHITGSRGHSVVLPCACTEVQIKPKQIKWTADLGKQNTVIFPQGLTSGNNRYIHRVQLLDSVSPGNLSLHLSDLTLSDRGLYRCEADRHYRDIRLTVKESVPNTTVTKNQPPTKTATTTKPASSPENKTPTGKEEATEDQKNTTLYVAIAVVAVVTLFTVCGAVFYCRVRGRRSARVESRGPNEKRAKEQEEDPDSVTYSTVIHREKDKNTKSQNQTPAEDSTEYAAIKFHT